MDRRRTFHVLFALTAMFVVLGGMTVAVAQTLDADIETPGGQNGSFGTTTIDGKQWQRLAFRPEIPLGKFAVALDVELFINDEGSISRKGWEFGNSTEALNSIYRKIYYVRYGMPRDPVFVKVGALDDVTLGYGFLMSHYRNTLDYPGVKNLGLRFELNEAIPGIKIHGMLNNFQDINNGGPLFGLRVAKPLGPFEVGGTLVYDVDQFGGMTDKDGDGVPDAIDRFPKENLYSADTDGDGLPDARNEGISGTDTRTLDRDADGDGLLDIDFGGQEITEEQRKQIDDIMIANGQTPFDWDLDGTRRMSMFNKQNETDPFGMASVDAAFILVDRPNLSLATYAQAGISIDDDDGHRADGWGLAAPGFRLIAGPFQGRVEYRYLRNEFLPEYFGPLYDHNRAVANFDSDTVSTRDETLDALEGQSLNGIFGDASLRLGSFLRVAGQYQYLHGDRSQQRLQAIAGLDKGVLQMVPKLSRVEAFYLKHNIGLYDDGFFERTIDMIYGYSVGFELGGGVEVVWTTRWVHEPVGQDPSEVEASRQVNIATVVRF